MLVIASDPRRNLDFHIDTEDLVPWGRSDSCNGLLGVRVADILPVFATSRVNLKQCCFGDHHTVFPVLLPCCDRMACFECASQNLLGNDFKCFCGEDLPLSSLHLVPIESRFTFRLKCPLGCGAYFQWVSRSEVFPHFRDCPQRQLPPSLDKRARVQRLKTLVSDTAPRQPIYVSAPPEPTALLNLETTDTLGSFEYVGVYDVPVDKHVYTPVNVPVSQSQASSQPIHRIIAKPPKAKTSKPSSGLNSGGKGLSKGLSKTAKVKAGSKNKAGSKKHGVKGGLSKKELARKEKARIEARRSSSALARMRKAMAEKAKGPLIPSLVPTLETEFYVGSQVNRLLDLNRGILYIKHPRLWHRKATLLEKRYIAKIGAIESSCVKANLVRAEEVKLIVSQYHPAKVDVLKTLKKFTIPVTPTQLINVESD